jgi:hypothetical protein
VEFVVLAIVGMLLPVLAVFPQLSNRRSERRLFWFGFLVAITCAFFMGYPPDWKLGIVLSLFAAYLMLLTAYFSSSDIKIRGKIFAFHVSDSLPDPPSDGAPASDSEDPDS